MAFKAGDAVRLKAGGPDMNVEKIDSKGVYCVWFDRDHNIHRQYFAAETLQKGGKPGGKAPVKRAKKAKAKKKK